MPERLRAVRTARTAQSPDAVDAALRIPHPAALVAGSSIFVAAAALASSVNRLRHATTFEAPVAVTVAIAASFAATAVVLLAVPRLRTLPAALAGLALLDAAAPALQVGAVDLADTRVRVALLIIPTMIAAATLARAFFLGQLLTALGLAMLMLAFAPDDGGFADRGVEVVVVAAVLAGGAAMVRRISTTTARHISELRRLALTDKLTGVLNRRGLADRFGTMVRSFRRATPLGVVSIDIDHFKWFNDEYGHLAGDDVLRRVCQTLRAVTGRRDIVARTGGEELTAVVVGPAEPVAAAFRARLAALDMPRVTASIGIIDASSDDFAGPDDLWRVLDCADRAMYRAKTGGRDRVCRGELDLRSAVRTPLAPAPRAAAVPPPEVDVASGTSPLPGWVLLGAGAGGIVAWMMQHRDVTPTGLGQLHMTSMVVCIIIGVTLVSIGPLLDRFRWITGAVGTDVVVAFTVLDLGTVPARIIATLPLLVTGLMVAQHFGRPAILAHHGAVLAISAAVPAPQPTAAMITMTLLNAAIVVGSTELIHFLQQRNHAAAQELHRWSVTDPLTGLANRHGLELGFETLSRAQQLTVLALDVDDFKHINDSYGHAAGDEALIRLAAALRSVAGPDSLVCRTGGDEFVVLAPSVRPSALTGPLKRAAAQPPLPLSISIGSAVAAPYRLRSLWQLVDAADAALIRAKRASRAGRRSRESGAAVRPVAPAGLGGVRDQRTAAALAVIASEDGSSSETLTRTVSPSVMTPESNSRAS